MVEKWAIKPPSEVLLEDIEDFLACYSLVTGKTHILDAFPAEVVKLLSLNPKTSHDISENFTLRVGEGAVSDWVPRIEAVLEELCDLQLVESCSV